ncbi:MAG TPA: butyrate kinase, partial [Deltaproteobacteria bacterium]|nr:butyrate kinase [Deltaproteobacteria bacterium]
MGEEKHLLVINVGSTSTKVACFRGGTPECSGNIGYKADDLARSSSLEEQHPLRERDVMNFLTENGINPEELDMIVSRGGLGRPGPGGAYEIDSIMCEDLLTGKYGKHVS